ncbi:Hypothetical predicted protein [Marmota monax]|uniref:Dickkopf-related protein 4 n=1 Tax=Marmota monax TaxID=9995 RepID=A0A5E4B5B0_MARMO|nr:dickkopf-related protein 4 [Marmota monax]VTJ64913.1 Hypothetical predicted protein [Marmota monax]
MVLMALLGLSWFCSPLGALVLDFNNIKTSADMQGARKVSTPRVKALALGDVCTTMEDAAPILERQTDDQDGTDTKGTTEHPMEENKPKRKSNIKKPQGSKGQEGESCLRTFDCGSGLCCARHFWTKICKPVLLEGQVCSRRGHKDTAQAPEIFQRCDCGPGLLCRSQATGNRQHARLRICQKI